MPLGLIKQLKTNGLCAGLKGFAVESLQQNSQVFGSIAGVLLAHIVAPIYAAKEKGEEAASLAGGAMIGLGAAIAFGLLAPFVIKKIFDIVPKPEQIKVKYRQDMYKMYQTYSEPLSSVLAEVDKVKCPNGHYLVDDGPPTLAYLSEDGWGEVRFSAVDAVHTLARTAPVGIGDGSSRQYVCTAAYVVCVIVSLACSSTSQKVLCSPPFSDAGHLKVRYN